jgi:DNA-binding NtrC family response regulator
VEVIPPSSASLDTQVRLFKLKTVKEALRQHRGNITHTAAALGMTRPTLYKLLKEMEVDS